MGRRTCPRCGNEVQPPGLWSDTWHCPEHGGVAPLHEAVLPSDEALHGLARESTVPVWVPWPLPPDWLVTGLRWAGDDHSGPVATVLACSGPNPLPEAHPLDRSADLLLVAEQPGVGLGARLAGLDDVDPGAAVSEGPPHMKLEAAGHDVPLWCVGVDDAAAYVGEALGVWLWAVARPHAAGAVLLEEFALLDLRDPGHALVLPYGALSPRLADPEP